MGVNIFSQGDFQEDSSEGIFYLQKDGKAYQKISDNNIQKTYFKYLYIIIPRFLELNVFLRKLKTIYPPLFGFPLSISSSIE